MFEIKLLNLLQTYEKHVDQSYLGKIIANKVYKENYESRDESRNYENHQKIAKYWKNNFKELIIDCSRVDNVQKFIIQ